LGLLQGKVRAENCGSVATAMLHIIPAEGDEAIKEIAVLFREYAASLGVDLSFQNFEQELALLPGEYSPPDGRLFLGIAGDAGMHVPAAPSVTSCVSCESVAGCIALRKIDSEICEMKRLYVRPQFRGFGAGRALADAVIKAASEIGYRRMRLDTLPQMAEAQALYRALGFREIPPYRYNPIVGTRYFELAL
jgi:putative acetyltransferase